MTRAFSPGLHVAGRADPDRVVAHLHHAGVMVTVPQPARRAWASIAWAAWLRQRSVAAIAAYKEHA